MQMRHRHPQHPSRTYVHRGTDAGRDVADSRLKAARAARLQCICTVARCRCAAMLGAGIRRRHDRLQRERQRTRIADWRQPAIGRIVADFGRFGSHIQRYGLVIRPVRAALPWRMPGVKSRFFLKTLAQSGRATERDSVGRRFDSGTSLGRSLVEHWTVNPAMRVRFPLQNHRGFGRFGRKPVRARPGEFRIAMQNTA